MILAIETATRVCSVALSDGSGRIREERTEEYGGHSERLFHFIRTLQKENGLQIKQLDACLVSEGPGSYTGLRIGASGVKGLLYGREIPLFAVNTLAAMAWGLRNRVDRPAVVHAVVDARRHHLYHQSFDVDNQSIRARSPKAVRTLEELNEEIARDEYIVGTGWDRLDKSVIESAFPFNYSHISARHLIALYEWMGQQADNKTEKNVSTLLHKVQAAEFDPSYVTRKKPGT